MDIHGCPERAANVLRQYMKEKEIYYRYRRFQEKWEGISDEVLIKCNALMQELENVESMEARALKDDLHVIAIGEDAAFEELEVFFEKANRKKI